MQLQILFRRIPISCLLQFYWPPDSHVTSLLHLGNLFSLPYDDEVIQPDSVNPSESCWISSADCRVWSLTLLNVDCL
jgi:hypothetical protein